MIVSLGCRHDAAPLGPTGEGQARGEDRSVRPPRTRSGLAERRSDGREATKAESKTEQSSSAAKTYTLARLIAEAPAFLGVGSHVAAGAFHGTEEEELSIEEAKSLVKDFRARKVG